MPGGLGSSKRKNEKRGVSFEAMTGDDTLRDRQFRMKNPSEIGKIIEELPAYSALDQDDDDVVKLGDVQRMSTELSGGEDSTVHE